MDENVRQSLLSGAREILDEVRSVVGVDEKVNVMSVATSVVKVVDVVSALVNAVFDAESDTTRDFKNSKVVPKIEVGDVLTTAAELNFLRREDTVLLDSDHDVWQLLHGYWFCAEPELDRQETPDTMVRYGPFTVVWLP